MAVKKAQNMIGTVKSDKKFRNTKTDLYKKLTAELDHIHRIFMILKTEELKKINLTVPQLIILMRVWACNNNITPAELGRDLLRKPNTISLILRRMVRDGLIKKTQDPKQKNSHLLSITPEGERLLQLDKQGKALKKMYSKISEEQLRQLDSLLQALDEIAKKELSLLQKKSEYVGGDLYYD